MKKSLRNNVLRKKKGWKRKYKKIDKLLYIIIQNKKKRMDYKTRCLGVTFKELKSLDFRSTLGKSIQRVFFKKKKKEILQDIAKSIIYRAVWVWWCRYQRKHKGVTWFNPLLSENENELISMEPITTIPSPFYISVQESQFYVFDIRHFSYLQKNKFINPYTTLPFSETSQAHLETRYKKLCSWWIPKEEPNILSMEQLIRNKAVSLFQTMDFLGYYTDIRWFFNMEIHDLRQWYREAEDIWNYRTQLTSSAKKNINPFLNNFQHSLASVLRNRSKVELQKIVLHEIEHLIMYGINKTEKCLGCLYVMTVFVMLCPSAAESYPWLLHNELQ